MNRYGVHSGSRSTGSLVQSRSRLKEAAQYTMQLSQYAKGFVVAACFLALSARPAHAGQQDHQYSSSDVQAGLKLYTSECSLCHGPNGDLSPASTFAAAYSGARCPTKTWRV